MIHPAEASVLFRKASKLRKTVPGLKSWPPGEQEDETSPSVETGKLLWGDLFTDISKFPSNEPRKEGWLYYPDIIGNNDENHPIQLYAIDLKHDKCKLRKFNVDASDQANIVLEYGKPFLLDLHFYRTYDPYIDKVEFQFEPDRCSFGDKTRKAFSVDLMSRAENVNHEFPNDDTFSAIVVEQDRSGIVVDFRVIKCMMPGWWKLKIVSSHLNSFIEKKADNVNVITTEQSIETVSILNCILVCS